MKRGVVVLLGLIFLAVGLILLIHGLTSVTVCPYGEGCYAVITWPLVAGGGSLILLGTAGHLLRGPEVR